MRGPSGPSWPGDGGDVKRRDFLKQAAASVAGGSVIAACGNAGDGEGGAAAPAAHTGKRVMWRLASSFPRGLDTIYGGAEVLAERVEAMSGGQFKIRSYPAGEIVPGLQVLDAVQQGTVQVGHSATYYYTGKDPAFAFDTAVPFGLTTRQQIAWLEQGGGRELLEPLFSEFNIKAFYGGTTGAQMGGWFNREINSVADIAGLKMRIPGPGGVVMNRMGATVQVLAGGDIFPALERGAIDATEWVGPYDDEKLGFYKVAPYYYYPGWWEPGATLSVYVNQEAWASLSAEHQAIFRAATQEAALTMQTRYDALNPPALARLLANGVQLRPFPQDVMEAAERESVAVLEEYAAADPRFAKIYDAWKAYRQESSEWFSTAEFSYAKWALSKARSG
jgi:TRAP-type mannitol/chloroaromatic compound transport system substrate-binding protein